MYMYACIVTFYPIILPSCHFVAGTHTETSNKGKAARALTCTSSNDSETSTKRVATRASRTQSGLDTRSEMSTRRKATRNPEIHSGLGTESETSAEDEATRVPLNQPGGYALTGP